MLSVAVDRWRGNAATVLRVGWGAVTRRAHETGYSRTWGFLHEPSNRCTKQSRRGLVSTSNPPHRFAFLEYRSVILA